MANNLRLPLLAGLATSSSQVDTRQVEPRVERHASSRGPSSAPISGPSSAAVSRASASYASTDLGAVGASDTRASADRAALEGGAASSLNNPDAGHGVTASSEPLMQVGDLAREAGKTVRAIHLYEELQLLRPAARSKGRYRLYGPEALVRIRWIGKLQDMGFSLTDIQTIVKDWEESSSAPRTMVSMREVYAKKLEETREHLRRLEALEHDLRASLDYLDTCEVCEPARLLSACTSCDRHGCKTHVPDLIAGFRAN